MGIFKINVRAHEDLGLLITIRSDSSRGSVNEWFRKGSEPHSPQIKNTFSHQRFYINLSKLTVQLRTL